MNTILIIMKYFLIFYAIFFLIFTFIGFFVGRKDLKGAKFLETHIFKQVSFCEIDNVEYISYIKHPDTLFVFNVDTDSLIILNKKTLLYPTTKNIHDKNLLRYIKTTSIAISNKTLGHSIKDFIPKKKSSKKIAEIANVDNFRAGILGTIMGMLSGYSFGYWVATASAVPDETSGIYNKVLLNRKKWISAKLTLLNRLYNECLFNLGLIENESTRKKLQKRLNDFTDALIHGEKPLRTDSNTFRKMIELHETIIVNTIIYHFTR